MNKNFIIINGELYHAAPVNSWKKDDHKYISREWKNGKWVYTYPSPSKKTNSNKANPLKSNETKASNISNIISKLKQSVENYSKKSSGKTPIPEKEKARTYEKPEDAVKEKAKPSSQKLDKRSSTENKTGNMFEKFGETVSSIIKDVDIKNVAKKSIDWVDKNLNNISNNTIAQLSTNIDKDTRLALYISQKRMNGANAALDDAMHSLESSLYASNGDFDKNSREQFEAKASTRLEFACELYLQTEAEYQRARELAGFPPLTSESNKDWAHRARTTDSPLIDAEAKLMTNRLMQTAVRNYMSNDPASVKAHDEFYNYLAELEESGSKIENDLIRDLKRYDFFQDWGRDRNYEFERIERLMGDIVTRFGNR